MYLGYSVPDAVPGIDSSPHSGTKVFYSACFTFNAEVLMHVVHTVSQWILKNIIIYLPYLPYSHFHNLMAYIHTFFSYTFSAVLSQRRLPVSYIQHVTSIIDIYYIIIVIIMHIHQSNTFYHIRIMVQCTVYTVTHWYWYPVSNVAPTQGVVLIRYSPSVPRRLFFAAQQRIAVT